MAKKRAKKQPTKNAVPSAAGFIDMREHRRSEEFSQALMRLATDRLEFFHATRKELQRLTTIFALARNDIHAMLPLLETERNNAVGELEAFIQAATVAGNADAAERGKQMLAMWLEQKATKRLP